MLDLKLKKHIDFLIKISGQHVNRLANLLTLKEVVTKLDEILVPATTSTEGFLSASDKTKLDALVAFPKLSVKDKQSITTTQVTKLSFPNFKSTLDFGELVIEPDSFKFSTDNYANEHIITHNLNTSDLNISVRVKDIGTPEYYMVYPKIIFMDDNNIKVLFDFSANPKIFISKF